MASVLATSHKQRNSNIEALYEILKGKTEPTTGGNLPSHFFIIKTKEKNQKKKKKILIIKN